MSVVEQTIQHGAHGRYIAEHLAPVFDWTIRSEQGTGSLVAPHDDFQQILGGGVRQLAHAEVVDNKQRHGGDRFHILFARAAGDRIGQFIKQDVFRDTALCSLAG